MLCLKVMKDAASLFICLAVTGFVAILLLGPILAVAGALISVAAAVISFALPFALVGLAIWAPYQLATRSRITARQVGRSLRPAYQAVLVNPARTLGRLLHALVTGIPVVCGHVVRLIRPVGGIIFETVCGALFVSALGWLLASGTPGRQEEFLAFGFLGGAVLGFLVGLRNYWPIQANQE